MKPDYENAAIKATETLIRYGISSAPVSPLPILKKIPGVFLVSFEEMSKLAGFDRKTLVMSCGECNQDAVTTVCVDDEKLRYIVAYNQKLPQVVIQRSLARELGHIVLGHDGTKPDDVRTDEAIAFANYLLVPRALIYSVQASGIRITMEVLGNLTGCYDHCLSCIRKLPAVHVPAELNRIVRDNFMDYIINFFEYQKIAMRKDVSAIADLGRYMEGYEE